MELLAPAGSFEKLECALLYGADAVYLGGEYFNLRSAADNFTLKEIEEGISFAHKLGRKVFIVVNNFFHDEDLPKLKEFAQEVDNFGCDAFIISDLGGIKTLAGEVKAPLHLSTQASCLNGEAAKFWADTGVKRVVLGRESSLKEAAQIKAASGLEVEMFVHGSMCMAFSGHCTISNYTSGRDSNRGGCAHSCRFEYSLDFKQEETQKSATFMSSKDLLGLQYLSAYRDAGVDSLKIEGRMKSPHYVGSVVKIYRRALDVLGTRGKIENDLMQELEGELRKISHRDYTSGSLHSPAGEDSIFSQRDHLQSSMAVGQIVDIISDQFALLRVQHPFDLNDPLDFLSFEGPAQEVKLDSFKGPGGEELPKVHPGMLIRIPYNPLMQAKQIVRRGELQ